MDDKTQPLSSTIMNKRVLTITLIVIFVMIALYAANSALKGIISKRTDSSFAINMSNLLYRNIEKDDFEKAKAIGTVKALQGFLNQWPNSPQVKEATNLLNDRQSLDDFEKDDPAFIDLKSKYTLRLYVLNGLVRCQGECHYLLEGDNITQDYSNTRIINDIGDFAFLKLYGDNDLEVGNITITGKIAIIGQNNNLLKGTGYAKAESGKYLNIDFTDNNIVTDKTHFILQVRNIQWDDIGKTISVHGLAPVIKQLGKPDITITSDKENPDVNNGILIVNAEGGREFRFKCKFDNGVKLLQISHPDVPINKDSHQ